MEYLHFHILDLSLVFQLANVNMDVMTRIREIWDAGHELLIVREENLSTEEEKCWEEYSPTTTVMVCT
jgi:hypothetical protein